MNRTASWPARRVWRALVALLGVSTAVIGPAAGAGALSADTVRLPVMPSRLAAGSACTGDSGTVVKAVPWEQQNLQLARTRPLGSAAGVTVAVVDTGVSLEAPALAGRVTAVGGAGDDCVGHGTFVAGLIAAAPVAGVGFSGAAPRARILAVRGTDRRGTATDATVADGIRAAVAAGARVVVVSPALTRSSSRLHAAVADAARHDALIVAAAVPDAPADGSSAAPPADYWPAAEPGVLSVVDIDVRGQRPRSAYPARHADLAAPGDGVLGIGPRGRGHFIGSGPSAAAGYTAAAAALVRSAQPGLSAAATAHRLVRTAYPADVPRLDLYGALTSVPGADPLRSAPAGGEPPVRPARDEPGARATRRALAVAGAGLGLVLSVAWAASITTKVRARRRRPSEEEPVTTSAAGRTEPAG
ncbi:S8 family serine peptidase [Streptomyces sp. NPDC004542]|uniref:S8 family serine peptidase n=1 Tax=Streptomyces sp. NPDC004542 TaxID=3154281 RepID=UPI0033A15648